MSAETDRWYNVMFSITDGNFTANQMQQLRDMDVAWEVLNRRNGRLLIDIVGPRGQLTAIRNALTALGRDPKTICVHTFEGELVGQPDKAEFLAVSGEADWAEAHQFAGWAPRLVP